MSYPDNVYKLAFAFLKKSSVELVRALPEKGLTPEDFFTMETSELSRELSLPANVGFDRRERDDALSMASEEEELISRHGIRSYFILDEDYPVRLSEIPDAPVIFYQLGETDLNSPKIINMVGTRKSTPYGIDFCNRLVNDLSVYFPDLIVVSGLAFGIDAASHRAALESGVATVGVVAHGLNMIYPSVHRDLARRIIHSGGSVVSEYKFGEQPYRQRFLERNRIIAALSDVTIVVESDVKGGAMSTANMAFSYSRDVMALPGKISDQYSSGCNMLIRKEKAHLLTCAADLIELMGWKPLDLNIKPQQRNLFPELEGDPKLVYDIVRFSKEPIQVDKIHQLSMIPIARLMAVLGEMEFDGILLKYPGNRYHIS